MTNNPQQSFAEGYLDKRQRYKQILDELKLLFKIARALTYWVSYQVSLPIDTFLHRRVGERHLYAIPVVITTILIVLSGPLLTLVFSTEQASRFDTTRVFDPAINSWANWSAFAFFIAACIQVGFITLRHRRGDRWHSRSPGIPWGFWLKIPRIENLERVRQFLEPVLVAIAGLLLFRAGVKFGVFFMVSALALFSREYIQYRNMREQIIDRLDAQIEADNWEHVVEQATEDPAQTQGFVVPGISRVPQEQRRSLAEDMALLEPKVSKTLVQHDS